MTFTSDLVGTLPELRGYAESLMADTFAAYSPDPESLAIDDDGFEVDGFADEGATFGKVSGRSRDGDTNTRTVTVGGVDRPVMEGGLHIPLGAPVPAIGWEYECTAVGVGSDLAILGRRYRVVDVPAKAYATARRLDVVDVTP